MFYRKEDVRNFFNGNSFVKEDKAVPAECTTKFSVKVDVSGSVISALAPIVESDASTQSTLYKINIFNAPPGLPKGYVNKIKKYRDDFRLSQAEAALLIGFSKPTIQNIESEEGNFSRDTVFKVLKFLELCNLLSENVSHKFVKRTLFHSPIGIFGKRSAIEFAEKVSEDKRIFEVFSLMKKMYE